MTHGSDMTVSLLSVTPVKGLALHHPSHIDVTAAGIVGDRTFFLIDDKGVPISCTDLGGIMTVSADYDAATGVLSVHGPDGLMHSAVVEPGEPVVADFYGLRDVAGHIAAGWDSLFTGVAGTPVRLVIADSGAFDVSAITLLGAASTDALATHNDGDPVDGRRFRMNVEISGSEPLAEDAWDGRTLRLGDTVLRVGGPVKRCAATTRHPDTGEIDLQTLKLIGATKGRQETPEFGAGFYFGVYADVVTPGRIHVGDPVALVD
jgi:uncharacterized protein